MSLSARRAWIEILGCRIYDMSAAVALRKESVDRNPLKNAITAAPQQSLSARRAWIEITKSARPSRADNLSLSARRAWIEINNVETAAKASLVALRKESVDRNCSALFAVVAASVSLSARRAWIEIFSRPLIHHQSARRSPQGERG